MMEINCSRVVSLPAVVVGATVGVAVVVAAVVATMRHIQS